LNRFISISLLCLFSYNSIGHFLLLGGTLCAWKHEVKYSIMQATKEEDLVKISLSEKVTLLDSGKELELDGKRYDIVRKDATHYFCFQDEKETHLIKKMLGNIVKKASTDNKHSIDFSIFKNIFKIYFIENQGFIFIKMIFVKINQLPTCILFSQYLCIFFIPPKKIV
jgi:hypothetical protein